MLGVLSLIKKAVLGYYTDSEIFLAKEQLFNKCDPSIIGLFRRRVNTSSRTEKDANVDDIIEALRHLDRSQSCPIFAVSAGRFELFLKFLA